MANNMCHRHDRGDVYHPFCIWECWRWSKWTEVLRRYSKHL